jgi:molecular chaperone GrpE
MNPEYNSKLNPLNETDLNDSGSIDDFIKELEAKEKALDISPELVVEVEDFEIEQEEMEKIIQAYQKNNNAANKPPPNVFNDPVPNKVTFSELEAEVSKLKQEVAKKTAEKSEIQENFRRRQTDFENFRNRTERERAEIFRSVISNLAAKILPVVDNLNRALDSSVKSEGEKSIDFQHFVDGVGLINQQLSEVLGEMGIQPIISLGKPFDPHYHEAVATVTTDRVPHNTVIEELIRGYHIDNKVIRPSMVKVSSSSNSESAPVELEID